jgi:hypothetical protein
MLEAFDLTGSLRDAGELAGVSHHTVACSVAARDAGALSDRAAARPQLIDEPRRTSEAGAHARAPGRLGEFLPGVGLTASSQLATLAPVAVGSAWAQVRGARQAG